MGKDLDELMVCPKMWCDALVLFPEASPTLFCVCARHGLLMVKVPEQPFRKTIYRYIMAKVFKPKYATHKSTPNIKGKGDKV